MKVKFGLRMKFTLIFTGLMLIITASTLIFLHQSYQKLFLEQKLNYAKSVASLVEWTVDADGLKEYAEIGKIDEEYYNFLEVMKQLQKDAGFYYLYIVAVENDEDGIYFFDLKFQNNESILNHGLGEYNPLKENYPGLGEVLETKSPSDSFDKTKSDGIRLDSVYVPILGREGEVAAFVGIDFDNRLIVREINHNIFRNLRIVFVVTVICFLVMLAVIQFSILRPVYKLKEHADRVSDGEFDDEIEVKGHDELSEILRVFNRMEKSIAGNMEEMRVLNETYYRYIPSKIFPLLGKDSILDIQLGDETNSMLCVFSFQLTDFERNIRKKGTREMMDAMNQILQVGISVVNEHEGMVENFQNAGFTALFEGNCEAALLSAVRISQKLNQMADTGQIEKNRAGVGVVFGLVTLGIVGQEKRYAAITVSPFKDTACWLQSIAEQYHAHILITQETADQIPRFFESYHTRTLGFLYNTYTGYSGRIYDVYDGDDGELFDHKEATKELFEKGVELYCLKKFSDARQKFIAVLKLFRKDRAAKEYLHLCDRNCAKKNQEEIDIYFSRME